MFKTKKVREVQGLILRKAVQTCNNKTHEQDQVVLVVHILVMERQERQMEW